MSFPENITIALTGVTASQLRNWRSTGLLIPEVNRRRPPLYSFRDLVALRTVARLRAETSLQKVRKAFNKLPEFDLTDHPSEYRFAVENKSIYVWTDKGFMDIVEHPGQIQLYTMHDIFRPFRNLSKELVSDFERPRERLQVNPRRLGGWPTIENSRIPFDTVANALRGPTAIPIESLQRFYPGVTPPAARDALDFAEDVNGRGRSA